MMSRKRRVFIVTTGFVTIFIVIAIQRPDYLTSLWDMFGKVETGTGTQDIDPVSYDDNLFHTSKTFRCNGRWMDEYSRYHANSLNSQSSDRKFLVYYCTGHKSGGCGGYGNRMISIVSLFYLAVVLNRTFMIQWGGPELLETYLQPNRINWEYNSLKFKGLKSTKRYWGLERTGGYDQFFLSKDEETFLRWTQGVNFRTYLNNPVEQVSTIWYFADKLWDNPHTKRIAKNLGMPVRSKEYPYAMIGCAMSFLFKKSKALIKEFSKVQAFIQDRPRPFIGIHIRSSDFHFGSNNPHSVRTRDPAKVFACAERVEKAFKRKYFSLKHKNFTWILAADNKDIKTRASKDYPSKIATLDIIPHHLDVSTSRHQDILRDILMDQLMILECDFFILTQASTFSAVIAGRRQFPAHSTTYGEHCQIDEKKITLAPKQKS